jgi:hypothetical protein
VFDARPQPDDDSPLDQLIRAFPALLDRLASVPDFLLWIETDRLIPPWDVQQDVFEAYLEDAGVEDDPAAEVQPENEEEEGEEEGECGEGDGAGADEEAERLEFALPDEPVTPFADPPTGPFDRSDPAALDFLHRTFAAVVTKFDAELGLALEQFRARGLDRTAALLVTSERGYPIGEHGQVGPYRPWLHQAVVQVPLLLRLPEAEHAGRRVWAFTQPADVAPTLLSLLGASPPAGPVHGIDLLPLARGEVESVRPYACSGWVVNGVGEWAIHTPDRSLLLPGPQPEGEPDRPPRLFEKPEDRWEVNDLRGRLVEEADRLEAVLREYVAAAQREGPLVVPVLEEGERPA